MCLPHCCRVAFSRHPVSRGEVPRIGGCLLISLACPRGSILRTAWFQRLSHARSSVRIVVHVVKSLFFANRPSR